MLKATLGKEIRNGIVVVDKMPDYNNDTYLLKKKENALALAEKMKLIDGADKKK